MKSREKHEPDLQNFLRQKDLPPKILGSELGDSRRWKTESLQKHNSCYWKLLMDIVPWATNHSVSFINIALLLLIDISQTLAKKGFNLARKNPQVLSFFK